MKLKQIFGRDNLGKLLWLALITTMFFSVRKVFDTPEATLIGEYSDFTSLSLYASDLVVAALLAHGTWTKWFTWNMSRIAKMGIVIILALFLLHVVDFNVLMLYKTLKWVELIALFEISRQYFGKNFEFLKTVSIFFLYLCGIQVIIAIFQTFLDKSVGITWLGEPILNIKEYGVAKYVTHGTTNLRGYGTFPHPNPLSAFLVAATMLCFTSISSLNKVKNNLISITAFVAAGAGLFLTRSLAGLVALLAGVLSYFWYVLLKKANLALKYKQIFIFLSLILVIFASTWPLFIPRGENDEPVYYRNLYNHVGWSMVKERPILGFGVGQSMLHMERFSDIDLATWEIQPVHNYFLLAATEGGVILALSLISLFLYTYYILGRSIWNKNQNNGLYKPLFLAMLVSFLILMQFDHYFYTLQQTQLLLWLILGIILSYRDCEDQSRYLKTP